MNSIWQIKTKSYPKLNSNLECDVCIVGGGIAGFLTAYFLSLKNFNVILLEANKIFQSTTVNTTAYITALQDLVYSEIKLKHGIEMAKQYFHSQTLAIKLFEDLINQKQIDCNFEKLPAYLFARKSTKLIEKEFEVLKEIGANVEYINHLPNLPLQITGALKLEDQASFHPLKFLTALEVNFKIFENSRVEEIIFDNKEVFANGFKVKANHIVIATHYPIFNLPELMFTKMYQSTSYCIAYKNTTNLKGLYVEDIENGLTFRNFEDNVIIGGFDHRTGRKQKVDPFVRLEMVGQEVFPNSKISGYWRAQDCITFDYIPFAGRIANFENCYCITGFNKWGMTNSIICAKLICDLIQNKKNEFENLFSLSRVTLPNSPIKTTVNFAMTCKGLFKSFLILPFKCYKRLKKGDGGIFLVNGKKCGVFRDENGNFYKVDSKCGHLGCELIFNKHTKTFDCECHGSRFNFLGEILNEPTVKQIKIK